MRQQVLLGIKILVTSHCICYSSFMQYQDIHETIESTLFKSEFCCNC